MHSRFITNQLIGVAFTLRSYRPLATYCTHETTLIMGVKYHIELKKICPLEYECFKEAVEPALAPALCSGVSSAKNLNGAMI